MKKSIIASAVVVTGLFGAGIAVGQVGGIPGSSAASAITATTTTTATGAIATSTTQEAPDRGGHQDGAQDAPHADGTVTAINGDTLTISAGTDPTGTTEYTGVTTVALTGATQYDAGHDSTAAIGKSSIKVGSYVIAEGTLGSDGKTLTATSLRLNAGGPVAGR